MTAVRTFPDEWSMSQVLQPMSLGWLKVGLQMSTLTLSSSWREGTWRVREEVRCGSRSIGLCDRWLPVDFCYAPFATEVMWQRKMSRWVAKTRQSASRARADLKRKFTLPRSP